MFFSAGLGGMGGDVLGDVTEGGGIEEDERRVDKVETEVAVEDSRDRAFGSWTSISSFTVRFRFFLSGGGSTFISESLAAAAFRLEEDMERERFLVKVPLVCTEATAVLEAAAAALLEEERVCRIAGDLSGVRCPLFILLCFMALAYGDPLWL